MTDLPSVFRRIYGHSGWWLTLELEVELNEQCLISEELDVLVKIEPVLPTRTRH
jgi:hypothetical protein